MDVQVAVPAPAPAPEFNFDSACSSPFITAPSSPQHIAPFFFSAPTSPSRRNTAAHTDPQTDDHEDDDTLSDQDFEFGFSGHIDTAAYLSAADELFDCGRIRPLQPLCSSARSPKRVKSRKSKDRQSDFNAAPILIQETPKLTERDSWTTSSSSSSSSSSSRHVRHGSLTPLRISDIMFEQQDDPQSNSSNNSQQVSVTNSSNLKSYASSAIFSFSKTYKKWNLKDFLLFRSASEGRPSDKETLKKYAVLSKAAEAGSSFRSTGSMSRRRSGAVVSAHELHYTSKRAAAEEMRKKTYLPYRQGLLGCIGLPGDMPP